MGSRLVNSKSAIIACLMLTLLIPFPNVTGQYGSVSSASRTSNLTIKIVFLGISASQINETYLNSPINLPQGKYQTVTQAGVDTGVFYDFHYQTVFANSSLVQNFVDSLGKINVTAFQDRSLTPASQWNPYFSNSTSGIRYVRSSFYNASAVEDWFSKNLTSFGTAPLPGYTLFVADLHGLVPNSFTYTQYQQDNCQGPSIPNPCSSLAATATVHYYNRTVVDQDLGEIGTRHYMTGWGGNGRFYYIDLSAGPSYWTGSQPVQVAAQVSHVDATYNATWLTQVVSDYVSGAVYNLFAPDQLYPISYSQKYVFHLFVIDNRTQSERLIGPSLQQALNVTEVESQLSSLAPYANVTVTPQFANIDDYPSLAKIVAASSTGLYDPVFGRHVVDARPVWDWLSTFSQNNVKLFLSTIRRDTGQIDIPAFIFAFKGDYNFGFTFEGDIFKPSDEGVSSIYGVALPDMAFISHGQIDLNSGQAGPGQNEKGLGVTGTVVHELGHEMGLVHPFNYDPNEDFVDSVMAYYPSSTHYSQFDRDNFLRGIIDELLGYAQAQLASAGANLFNLGQINAARNAMNRANQEYNAMSYQAAVQDSLIAASNAESANSFSSLSSFPSFAWGIVGAIIGVVIGLLVGFLLFKGRGNRMGRASGYNYRTGACPTCGGSLRWDPMLMHWYCDNCKQAVQQ